MKAILSRLGLMTTREHEAIFLADRHREAEERRRNQKLFDRIVEDERQAVGKALDSLFSFKVAYQHSIPSRERCLRFDMYFDPHVFAFTGKSSTERDYMIENILDKFRRYLRGVDLLAIRQDQEPPACAAVSFGEDYLP